MSSMGHCQACTVCRRGITGSETLGEGSAEYVGTGGKKREEGGLAVKKPGMGTGRMKRKQENMKVQSESVDLPPPL